MQIEKLLEEQMEKLYSLNCNEYGAIHNNEVYRDWHKQSLKQFIDGLVEWEEGKIVQKFRGFPLAEYEEGINDARKLTIVYLKEIGKQLE